MKKLGDGAIPFRLQVPAGAPGSVTLQSALEDEGEPCGVHYYVKIFVGDSEIDRSHRRCQLSSIIIYSLSQSIIMDNVWT